MPGRQLLPLRMRMREPVFCTQHLQAREADLGAICKKDVAETTEQQCQGVRDHVLAGPKLICNILEAKEQLERWW